MFSKSKSRKPTGLYQQNKIFELGLKKMQLKNMTGELGDSRRMLLGLIPEI